MSKPTLDQVEAESLKGKLELLVRDLQGTPRDTTEFKELERQVQPLAERYHYLTGTWYTHKYQRETLETGND